MLAAVMQQDTQTMQRIRIARLQRQRPFVELLGLVQPPGGVVLQRLAEPPGIGIPGGAPLLIPH